MSWSRWLTWLAGGALVIVAIVWGFMPRPVLVEAAPVTRGPLEVTIREEGKTRVAERYVISAPVPAYARRLELEVGDEVLEGEVLLRLDPLRSRVLDPRSRAEALSRVNAAEATLEAAREQVEVAEADAGYAASELERIRTLYERGGMSRDMLERAEAEARRARARLEAARRAVDVAGHELEAARTALRYSAAEGDGPPAETVPLRSPVDGKVLRVIHESEGVVGSGEPLVEVGNPDALEVEVEVLSSDAVRIAPGMQVRFERWGGDHELEGVVRTVEPVGFTEISALGVEEQRVLVIADLTSPPEGWRRLGDGYRVEAVFLLWVGEDVLQIPSSALFRHQGDWAVFTADGDTARLRAVELGRRSGLAAEIVSGLSEGDLVITHPDDSIEDGTGIRVREER